MVLSAIIVFFIGTVYIMPSVQAVLQEGFTFNNPTEFTKRYPLDTEGLTSESLVVGDYGRRTVDYGSIHVYPYEGFLRKDPDFKPENLNLLVILDLKELITNGYEVYVFKKDMWPIDEKYFRYLEAEHSFILQKHSDTFCKLILQDSKLSKIESLQSDPDCYSDVNDGSLKVWKIWPKTPDQILQ